MTTLTHTLSTRAGWRDYLELTKPKVVALMIITSAIGVLIFSWPARSGVRSRKAGSTR